MNAFDLNLRHLRALPAIVRHGSMSAAADAVSLSQPALTQGLAKLEAQIGTALFDRRPDGMAATAAGLTLAARAEAAVAHLAGGVGGGAAGRRGFARAERLITAAQARALLMLADAGGFSAAAQASGVSQPALHRAVRDLEQVVGAALVERRGRGVALTEAGRRLARGARLAAAEIAAALAEIAPAEAGPITVGAMPLSRARLLPEAVARLVREEPAARLDIVEGSWRELAEPLREGVLDLMIGALREGEQPGLAQVPLFTDRLAIVARAGHPLAGQEAAPPAALAGFPWVVGQPGTPLRREWEALFAGRPLSEAPIVCGSVMVIRGVLTGSDMLTLLSPDQVALELAAGVLARIGPPIGAARVIGVTTRRDWRPSPLQARLLALLAEVAGEIMVPLSE